MKFLRFTALIAIAVVGATWSTPVDAYTSLRNGATRCSKSDNDKCDACYDQCKNDRKNCDQLIKRYKGVSTCGEAVDICNNLCTSAPCCH